MRPAFWLVTLIILTGVQITEVLSQPASFPKSSWAYDIINIPRVNRTNFPVAPVIVAVVDDGFRLTHKELKDMIYVNPNEIPGNQLDDDGNDYPDDVSGWDVSDDDADVSVPESRTKDLYHGTYVASIIAKVAKLHYGEVAGKFIRIMPVKAISDLAAQTYVKDGYKGIKYAIDNGARIICIAWSGGEPGRDELKILKEAEDKGVMLIGAAGNFLEEKVYNPANLKQVMAVAGIDSNLKKYEKSNYGMKIDISAPAQQVFGANPEKDNAYIFDDGTSSATALVTGCAAVLLSENMKLSGEEIRKAIINSSQPFQTDYKDFGGKLGSGIVNLGNAIEYINNPAKRENMFSSLRPKGDIDFDKNSRIRSYDIKPVGAYLGFWLESKMNKIKNADKKTVSIFTGDTLWNRYTLSNFPQKIYVPAQSLRIEFGGNFKGKEKLNIEYSGKTIDSTTLYCRDVKYYSQDSLSIEDGSGNENYANNCSCKWIIKAPEGKTIKITFDWIDTQPNVDFVYIVDGETAIPSNFISKFSGQNLPPVVYSQTNVVLIWFVTDKAITGQGWKFHYEFVHR